MSDDDRRLPRVAGTSCPYRTAFTATSSLGELADPAHGAAKDDDLEAGVLVPVHVQGGGDGAEVVVLHFRQLVGQRAGAVIVDEGQHADRLAALLRPLLLDELRPEEVADELAAGGVAARGAKPVEGLEERVRQGDGESGHAGPRNPRHASEYYGIPAPRSDITTWGIRNTRALVVVEGRVPHGLDGR